jgi:hypothetical protein
VKPKTRDWGILARSKVFLSCGQGPSEKAVGAKIGKVLEKRGFDVYIAIDVQAILEINSGIIRELKNSDYYLFVNFRREQLGANFRGSPFSNQVNEVYSEESSGQGNQVAAVTTSESGGEPTA